MRLHGYCTGCRKVRLVRVSNHALAMLAIRRIPEGICAQCEEEEIRARQGTTGQVRRPR